jgi:hypothetical protein
MIKTIKADDAGMKKTRKWFRQNAPAGIRLHRKILSGLIGGEDDEGT